MPPDTTPPPDPEHTTRWCYLSSDHDGISEIFHVVILIVIALIVVLELIFNLILLIRELRTRRKAFLTRVKTFMIPLILADTMHGCTFVPLFVLELTKNNVKMDCVFFKSIIAGFAYFFITRVFATIFICYKTYLRVNKPRSSPNHTRNDHNFTFVINISLLWSPGIASVFALGVSSIRNDIILPSFTIVYFVITMGSTCACYIMVIKAINRDKKTEDGMTFTDTPYYRQAHTVAIRAFMCFLFINVPLILTSLASFAFHDIESNYHQPLYLLQLALVSIQAIANPIMFVKRLIMVKKGIYKICCIITFSKEIRYKESIMIRLQDSKNPLGPQTRTRAAAARAASVRRGLGGVDASDGGVFGNISKSEVDYDGCVGACVDDSGSSGSSDGGDGDAVGVAVAVAGVDVAGVLVGNINDTLTPEDEPHMNDNSEPSLSETLL